MILTPQGAVRYNYQSIPSLSIAARSAWKLDGTLAEQFALQRNGDSRRRTTAVEFWAGDQLHHGSVRRFAITAG